MNDDCPEILASTEVYKGKQVQLVVDTIKEQGKVHTREVVLHPGSAVILALDENLSVFLVRQYRHATRKYLLELPAGSLEPGERPEDAAVRELQEEVGVRAEFGEALRVLRIAGISTGENVVVPCHRFDRGATTTRRR